MWLKFRNIISLLLLLVVVGCGREDISEPVDNGTPPAIPTGLTVDAAFDGQIGISWQQNNEADISEYNVYRSTMVNSEFRFISFTTNTYYDDIGLSYDSTYYYKISAVDQSHRESGLSAEVSAIPKNIYTPIAPYVLNINARNQDGVKSIFLSWSPSIDNDISHYEIYRDTTQFDSVDSTKLIAKVANTFYSDKTNLILLQKYYYRIIAVDKGNLKSKPTDSVVDYILDEPVLISPANEAEISDLTSFVIKAVSLPASYNFVIQNSPAGGVISNIGFSSNEEAKEITLNTNSLELEPYKTYFWRVLTFTNNNSEPNSYSGLFSFYYNPK